MIGNPKDWTPEEDDFLIFQYADTETLRDTTEDASDRKEQGGW